MEPVGSSPATANVMQKVNLQGAPTLCISLRKGWAMETTPIQDYDCFSIVNVDVVPCSLSLYSTLIDLPSDATVIR